MLIAKTSSISPTSGVWTLFAISQAVVVPLWRRQLCEHSCSSRHSWAIRGEQTLVPWQNLDSVPPQDRTSTGELGEAFISFIRWQILTLHFWFHQNSSFWFATGGAGFCVSRTLALRMAPLAVDGGFVQVPMFLSFGWFLPQKWSVIFRGAFQLTYICLSNVHDKAQFKFCWTLLTQEWEVLKI